MPTKKVKADPAMAHFAGQLTGLRDAQTSANTLFLAVSMRVFPGQISICIGQLNEEGCPHHAGGHHPSH